MLMDYLKRIKCKMVGKGVDPRHFISGLGRRWWDICAVNLSRDENNGNWALDLSIWIMSLPLYRTRVIMW